MLRKWEAMIHLVELILIFSFYGEVAQAAQSAQAPAQAQVEKRPVQPAKKKSEAKKPPAMIPEEIKEARERLAELGYWLIEEIEGEDASLRHALIAFQKIEGRPHKGLLTKEELEAIRAARRPEAKETGYPHIEIDLCNQVLYAVDLGGVSLRILPVSTGSGECFTEGGLTRRAITPIGEYKVQRKIRGWRKSPLGLLYYPVYFYDGVAIHGNPAVPPNPASHGCIRIPVFAAKDFFDLAEIGTPVKIYDSSGRQAARPLPCSQN